MALGRTPEDEYRDGLHKVSHKLQGQMGLLFTNQKREDVCKWASDSLVYGAPFFCSRDDVMKSTKTRHTYIPLGHTNLLIVLWMRRRKKRKIGIK